MKLSNKKPSKTGVKVGSGGAKQRSKLKIVLFSLIAVLVLTVVGFFGYDQYKARSLKAKAAGYVRVYNDGVNTISVCKVQNVFGIYVRAFATKPTWQSGSWFSVSTFDSLTPSKESRVAFQNSTSWWGNQVTAVDVFANSHSNIFTAVIYNKQGNYQTTPVSYSLAFTPWC